MGEEYLSIWRGNAQRWPVYHTHTPSPRLAGALRDPCELVLPPVAPASVTPLISLNFHYCHRYRRYYRRRATVLGEVDHAGLT